MSEKKIRGVSPEEYAKLRHQVESGQTTEEELVRKGLLTPVSPGKGLAVNLDEKVFRRGNPTQGKAGRPNECRVPSCTAAQSRRGLCNTHRIYASRLIKKGAANEQNLINRGLLQAKSNPVSLKRLPVKRSKVRSLRCSYPECKDQSRKRGLCRKHHNLYARKRSKTPSSQREQLDKDLIRRGLLLPEPKPEKVDPFQLGSKIRGNLKK
jgi:hypothetical protein